jgi:hypothetical protein
VTKIANGTVNEEHISAVVKVGQNWEMILVSGQRITLSEADAKQFLPADKNPPPPKKAGD